MARVITKTGAFRFQLDQCDSVYESLLEAIVYQSISGKAAATIYARIKALGSNGLCPTPAEILAVSVQRLREAGLSGAKAAAMKDLAQKTIDGVVPTLEAAGLLSDEELVERLISVRGIGAWTVESGCPAHPRLRRAKRFRARLRQERNSEAARTGRLRRTLAPLPHRSQLVHVARG
jgi:3-methyladenine DNA glycosylase/8-oxoguanine DNA glycosylase